MKDSCDATERSYGLDRSVLSGPVAWAVTDNPCRVSDGGGRVGEAGGTGIIYQGLRTF